MSTPFEVVSLEKIISVKKGFNFIPNLIRWVLSIIIAYLCGYVLFSMMFRTGFYISALAYEVNVGALFFLFWLPLIMVLFSFIVIFLFTPFWFLGKIERDSIVALAFTIILCVSFASSALYSAKKDSGWYTFDCVVLVVFGVFAVNFALNLIYILYMRGNDLGKSLLLNARIRDYFVYGFSLRRLFLLVASAILCIVRIFLIFTVGFLFYIPIGLVSLALPPLALAMTLALFLVFRQRIGASIIDAFRLLKARMQMGADERMSYDRREPILFLRSFFDDDITAHSYSGRILSRITGLNLGEVRIEECMVETIGRLGPVVAIKQPDTTVTPIGAVRAAAVGDWKEVVRSYLGNSKAIIAMYGLSPGLGWEFEEIFNNGYYSKLVIIVPPRINATPTEILETLIGKQNPPSILKPNQRLLALARCSSSGVIKILVAGTRDSTSYTLALRYCLNTVLREKQLASIPANVAGGDWKIEEGALDRLRMKREQPRRA